MGKLGWIVFMAVVVLFFTRGCKGNAYSVLGDRYEKISDGEEVDIPSHIPSQGLTIVSFTAEW